MIGDDSQQALVRNQELGIGNQEHDALINDSLEQRNQKVDVQSDGEFSGQQEIDTLTMDEDVMRVFYTIIANLAYYTNVSLIYYFLNHYGAEKDVNIFGIAFSWMMLADGIIFGISFSYRIMGSHAYGRQRMRFVGILLQRTLAIMMAFWFIVLTVNLNSRTILGLFMDQNENLDELSYSIKMLSILSLLNGLYYVLYSFYYCQLDMLSPVYSAVSSVVSICLFSFIYINVLTPAYIAVILAMIASRSTEVIILVVFILKQPKFDQTFIKYTSEAFQNLGPLLKLMAPVVCAISIYFFSPEIRLLFTGNFEQNQISSQIFYGLFMGFFVMISESFATSISSAIGILMVNQEFDQVRKRIIFTFASILGILLLLWGTFYIFLEEVMVFYNISDTVFEIVKDNFFFNLAINMLESSSFAGSSILQAMGYENQVTLYFFCTHLVGAPILTWYFVYQQNMQMEGIYISYVIFNIINNILIMLNIFAVDWTIRAKDLIKRLKDQQEDMEELIRLENSQKQQAQAKLIAPSQ